MSQSAPALLWFRQDLRLADNPALTAAAADGRPVVPLYILDENGNGGWPLGGASRWWLHQSLTALSTSLAAHDLRLILRRGPAAAAIDEVIRETGASAVYWNRCYEPAAIARDRAIKETVRSRGIDAESCNAALLFEPWTIKTNQGAPFKVFTPFWQALRRATAPAAPMPAPRLVAAPRQPRSDRLDDWGLVPRHPDWAGGLRDAWQPGEAGARARLARFIESIMADYPTGRDRPGREGTSRLSPHLHWGEIGPRQVWHAVTMADSATDSAKESYLRELGWREFAHHLLFHWPTLPEEPWRAEFARFSWQEDATALAGWRRGLTGYPIIDAGMRELWHTGWMHNRVRMIAASFLVKDLLIPWRTGEAWFWDTLVDADLAQNATNWQWVAGSGADAAPYFRIFNPVLQGEKFDASGDYVRRWIPELARLPAEYLHKPWSAPPDVLRAAGIALGRDYPAPIVDHGDARQRALAAFQALRSEPP